MIGWTMIFYFWISGASALEVTIKSGFHHRLDCQRYGEMIQALHDADSKHLVKGRFDCVEETEE